MLGCTLYSDGAGVRNDYGRVTVAYCSWQAWGQVPTSLALLPSQGVGSTHFLLLDSGEVCATCVMHNEQHATASLRHTHLPPH